MRDKRYKFGFLLTSNIVLSSLAHVWIIYVVLNYTKVPNPTLEVRTKIM